MLNVAEGGVGEGRGEGRALIQGTSAQDERSGLDPVAWGPIDSASCPHFHMVLSYLQDPHINQTYPISLSTTWSKGYHAHFTDEETESQILQGCSVLSGW